MNKVDACLVLTEGQRNTASTQVDEAAEASVYTDMQENGVGSRSNGENTETPEKLETQEPFHYDPVLQIIEIQYKQARAEYFTVFISYVG